MPEFSDAPDLGIFMSRLVWEEGRDVLEVSHDDDGDWCFAAGDESNDEDDIDDWLLLHLHHVVDSYPEVLEVADLPKGWIAIREKVGVPWSLRPLEESDSQ